ncbi:hypothetical protein FGLOB1_6665 [Fusarium globosum]|uniref:Uncharacterized protein n=1 Tax=Fusarium globosum TaxID=78864 RepID=A0A8H5YB08_9HYPO|nr:hypothetical protein FGLOB1_6665 [Fusarium globosum]
MVRTKTRARTLEERFPDGRPPSLGPAYTYVPNNRTFTDHTGKPALMCWKSRSAQHPLPPLGSWLFYMVHPKVPRNFDGCAVYDGLTRDSKLADNFRYEFFFLPGATAEECATHFRGELEARGTIWPQIRKVDRASKIKEQKRGTEDERRSFQGSGLDEEEVVPSKGHGHESDENQDNVGGSQLPGLGWPESDRKLFYRGYFFMCRDAEIETKGADGEARHVDLFEFDPIPQDWGYPEDVDVEEMGEYDPMRQPIRSRRLEVGGPYFDANVCGWMELKKMVGWEFEAQQATYKALELGWESW